VPTVAVTLLSKPGCHLCDTARDVVESVVRQVTTESPDIVVPVTERSILDDPALALEYSEEIPVVLIDGAVHTIWRADPVRLRTALLAAAGKVA
jgi:hypothetical protein